MLLDWNDEQPDPLPESEIKHVVSSAWKYKQNAQAAAAPAEAEFDLSDEGGDDNGGAAAPSLSKVPAKKLDKLPVMRLNDVDEHNIGRLFRFVNLAGKPRVLYWGPSALDPLVRVPQFWSVPEFRQQLCNKFGVRVTQTTDADGETVDKQVNTLSPMPGSARLSVGFTMAWSWSVSSIRTTPMQSTSGEATVCAGAWRLVIDARAYPQGNSQGHSRARRINYPLDSLGAPASGAAM